MNIIIFGDSCASCKQTIKNVTEAANAMDSSVDIRLSEDLIEMVRLNVFQTPAVVINGKVASTGKLLSFDDAKALIEQYK